MPSSGMWRRVDIVQTDVSEEHRLHLQSRRKNPRAGNQREQVAADFSSTLKMEAIRSSETSVYTISTRCHIPEDGILQRTCVFNDADSGSDHTPKRRMTGYLANYEWMRISKERKP
jgi:hypothetical protein